MNEKDIGNRRATREKKEKSVEKESIKKAETKKKDFQE